MSADMTDNTPSSIPPEEDVIDFQVSASLADHQGLKNFIGKYGCQWIDATNRRGYTALMYAAMNSSPQTLEFLLENGARFGITSNDGDTAIMLAEAYDKPDNVAFLHTWHMKQQERQAQKILETHATQKISVLTEENIQKLKQHRRTHSVFKNKMPTT